MNHTYIEENQVVDRYVMGTLPAEEADDFEDHYLSCQECLDRLDLAESEERGFKRMARQEVEKVSAVRQLALVAWLARLSRSRQMAALLMVLFVVAVLPGTLALREIRERDLDLEQTRSALAQEQERSAAGSRTAADAEKLRQDLVARDRELDSERQARAQAEEERDAASQPQGNVPILFLDAERSAGPSAGEPTQQVPLPQSPGGIVFDLAIDAERHPSYRAILRDPQGREVWRGGGLQLMGDTGSPSLSLSLPSRLFAPGAYTLVVEGLTPGRKPAAAGRFTFLVLPAR